MLPCQSKRASNFALSLASSGFRRRVTYPLRWFVRAEGKLCGCRSSDVIPVSPQRSLATNGRRPEEASDPETDIGSPSEPAILTSCARRERRERPFGSPVDSFRVPSDNRGGTSSQAGANLMSISSEFRHLPSTINWRHDGSDR